MSLVDAPLAVAVEPEPEVAGRSLKAIAWSRLKRDRAGMISLVVIITILLIALFAPLITHALGIDPIRLDNKALDDELGGLPKGWVKDGWFWQKGGWSWDHPLGVEPGTGRDILARLLYGARVSLLIATVSTTIIVILGTVVGIVSGYSRGAVDQSLGRLMDLILAFPYLLFSIALISVVPVTTAWRIGVVVGVISFFSWPYIGRIVRGQTLSLREREFVEAARSVGAGPIRILFRELLPNLVAPILVYSTLVIPTNIVFEASLSFLGVGVLPPTPSWGRLLSDAVNFYTYDPVYMFVPGLSIFIMVLAFNLFGDGLRDALDPKANR